jgi:TP901 family phage tail tape measure protein
MANLEELKVQIRADISDAQQNLRRLQQSITEATNPRQIINMQRQINTLSRTQLNNSRLLNQLNSDISNSMNNMSNRFKDIGSGMQRIGSTMLTSVSKPIIGGLAAAVDASMKFEKQLSATGAISDATGKDMEQLKEQALELGKATVFSAQEVAEGQTELLKSGRRLKDVFVEMNDVLSLASAGELEIARASEIGADMMNMFSQQGVKMSEVANIMAGAANSSGIDIEQFYTTMSYVGPAAASLKIPLMDLAGAVGVLGNNAIKGSKAGTGLRQFVLRLQPASKAAAAAMSELGLITKDGSNKFYTTGGKLKSLSDVIKILKDSVKGLTDQEKSAKLKDIFGLIASPTVNTLVNQSTDAIDKMKEAIGNVTAEEVAEKKLNNFAGSIEYLRGSLETFAIKLGDVMTPVLRKITDVINIVMMKFIDLNPSVLRIIVIFGLLVAAIAPLLIIVGTLITAIGSIAGVLALITPEIVATAAIIAGITLTIGALVSALVKAKFGSFGNAFRIMSSKIIEFGKNAKLAFQFFKDGLKGVGDPKALNENKKSNESKTQQDDSGFKKIYDLGAGIKKNILPILEKLKEMFMNSMKNIDFTALFKSFESLKSSLGNLYVAFKPVLKVVGVALFSALVVVLASLPPLIQAVASSLSILVEAFSVAINIVSLFMSFFMGDIGSMPGIAQDIWNSLKNIFLGGIMSIFGSVYGFVNNIIGMFTDNFNTLPTTASAVWDMIITKWSEAYNIAISSLSSFGSYMYTLWLSIWNGLKDAVSIAMKGISDGISAAGTFISNLWNSIWSGILDIFNSIVTGIIGIFTWLKDTAISIVSGMVNGVVNFFIWLYNHNYYFENLVNSIINAFNLAKTVVIIIWNAIKSVLTTVWNGIKTIAISVFNSIKSYITTTFNGIKSVTSTVWNNIKSITLTVWNGIKTVVSSIASAIYNYVSNKITYLKNILTGIWNSIKTIASNTWNSIKSIASSIWNSISKAISDKVSNVKKTISGIGTSIKETFTKLKDKAYAWGSNLIGEFLKGLKSKLGDIKGGATDVSKAIARILGFHSPAEEGPASDADKWIPNLMKMLIKGFDDAIPNFKSVTVKIAQAIFDGFKQTTAVEEMFNTIGNNIDSTWKDIIDKTKTNVNNMASIIGTALKRQNDANAKKTNEKIDNKIKKLKHDTDEEKKGYEDEYNEKIDNLDKETAPYMIRLKNRLAEISNLTKSEDEASSQKENESKKQELFNAISAGPSQESIDKKDELYADIMYANTLKEKEKATLKYNAYMHKMEHESIIEKEKAQQEYNDFVAKLDRERVLKERENETESLNSQITSTDEYIKYNQDALGKELKDNTDKANSKLETEIGKQEDYRTSMAEFYETINSDESINLKTRYLMQESSQDELIKLLETYYPDWQNAGQTFADKFIDGFNSVHTGMKQELDQLTSDVQVAKGVDINKIKGKLSDIEDSWSSTVDSMEKNSLQWNNYEDLTKSKTAELNKAMETSKKAIEAKLKTDKQATTGKGSTAKDALLSQEAAKKIKALETSTAAKVKKVVSDFDKLQAPLAEANKKMGATLGMTKNSKGEWILPTGQQAYDVSSLTAQQKSNLLNPAIGTANVNLTVNLDGKKIATTIAPIMTKTLKDQGVNKK